MTNNTNSHRMPFETQLFYQQRLVKKKKRKRKWIYRLWRKKIIFPFESELIGLMYLELVLSTYWILFVCYLNSVLYCLVIQGVSVLSDYVFFKHYQYNRNFQLLI